MDVQRDRNCSYSKEKNLIMNSQQNTKLKHMSCQAPFKRGISYECRTPAVDSDVGYYGADLNPSAVNILTSESLEKIIIQHG